MPTYQYACTQCGEELEAVQKFTDDPLQTCPECQGRLRKVYSAVGVVFKGSGFYRNDSRSSATSSVGSSNGAKETKSSDSKDSASGDSASSSTSSSGTASSSTTSNAASDSSSSSSSDSTKAAASA